MTFLPIGEWLTQRESLTPDAIGLIDAATDMALTYRQLNRRAKRLASVLAARYSIQQGDRVAMLAQNSPEMLDAFMACAKIGAIFVPLNWRLTVPELTTILRDCAPSLIMHDAIYTEQAEAVAQALEVSHETTHSSRRGFLGFHAKTPQESRATTPILAVTDFPPNNAVLADPPIMQSESGEEIALILYTSGTTGVPKGAMLSHRMITWNAINTQISWGIRENDITPTFAPFFHAGGLNVLTTPLYHCGGTVVLLQKSDPANILRAIEQYRCTIVFAVPTVFQLMMEDAAFDRTDFSSARFFVSGGSTCPLPVIERYAARSIVFRQGYGLTEVGVNCFSLAPEDAHRKAGSVGKPIFHSWARIVDEQDHDAAIGQEGELVLAGNHVCSGYWHRDEATRAAFRDGWWHTGDIARQDVDGYYYIVGRIKDMYKSGGENVYPAEVEMIMGTQPGIAEIAVIGIPDAKWGEVGVAFIVARESTPLTATDILAYCEERLAHFKIPKRIFFVESLPRNAMGKVLKNELRQYPLLAENGRGVNNA